VDHEGDEAVQRAVPRKPAARTIPNTRTRCRASTGDRGSTGRDPPTMVPPTPSWLGRDDIPKVTSIRDMTFGERND